VRLYARAVADAVLEGRANAVAEVVAADWRGRRVRRGQRGRLIRLTGGARRSLEAAAPPVSLSAAHEETSTDGGNHRKRWWRNCAAKTDAPMMECKKALTEADGDMAKAEEILRVKLGSKAEQGRCRASPPRAWWLPASAAADGALARGQLRDRLRRQERRLPRASPRALSPSWSRSTRRRTSPRCRRWPLGRFGHGG
jgi:hypothetical protein